MSQFKPIRTRKDLPKAGEQLPDNVIVKRGDEPEFGGMSHTPGPWHTVRRRDGIGVSGCSAFLPMAHEADVNLIAAAPELLEALKRLLARESEISDLNDLEFAHAAIAKAEGKK